MKGDSLPGLLSADRPTVRSRARAALLIVLMLFSFALIYSWWQIFIVIPAGYAGVKYALFFGGTRDNDIYLEGLNLIWPWNSVQLYDIRVDRRTFSVTALTDSAMTVTVDLSVFFHPDVRLLGTLHREVGPDYVDRIIMPSVTAAVRDVVGKVSHQQMHLIDNENLQQMIVAETEQVLPSKAIVLDNTVIEGVTLPQPINDAINDKLSEEQRLMAYDYILRRAAAEAERKRIEAAGIRDFQSIVGSNLTPEMLTWRGIQATVELGQSQNAKVVILGNSSKEMPVILGSELSPGRPAAPGTAAVGASPASTQTAGPAVPPDAEVTAAGPPATAAGSPAKPQTSPKTSQGSASTGPIEPLEEPAWLSKILGRTFGR